MRSRGTKGIAIIMAVLMVFGGIPGIVVPRGGAAYAATYRAGMAGSRRRWFFVE